MKNALDTSIRIRSNRKLPKKTLLLLASLIYLLYYLFTGQELSPPPSQPTPPPITSTPTPTTSPNSTESATVSRVIDGDTIVLSDGRQVRYIGIDTPETKDPRRPVGCFGEEAYQKNKELVEGKTINLVKDVSETDQFGRLLRYVYVGEIFVNEYLVREGFARISTYPPDVAHQEEFLSAQKQAQENSKGLWKICIEK